MHFDILGSDFSFFLKILRGPLDSPNSFSICKSVQPFHGAQPFPRSSTSPVSVARRSARMLLAAWNSADLRQIQNAIEQARTVETAGLSGVDVERIELVREIGNVMRQWMAGHKTVADLNASLDLLRHLAHCGQNSAVNAGLFLR
jgi:hypothetical protein